MSTRESCKKLRPVPPTPGTRSAQSTPVQSEGSAKVAPVRRITEPACTTLSSASNPRLRSRLVRQLRSSEGAQQHQSSMWRSGAGTEAQGGQTIEQYVISPDSLNTGAELAAAGGAFNAAGWLSRDMRSNSAAGAGRAERSPSEADCGTEKDVTSTADTGGSLCASRIRHRAACATQADPEGSDELGCHQDIHAGREGPKP